MSSVQSASVKPSFTPEWHIAHGDCLQILQQLSDCCIDAIVTDPPAGIGFMNKEWDKDKGGRDQWIAWLSEIMRECLRVLKPGGHALVWAIPRTSHWTATAIENAGFEVRDRVSHFFGSGFPKSLNIGNGRGTALKPACEDWWLARKPLDGTVAANVLEHGTGALSIDACRIGYQNDADRANAVPGTTPATQNGSGQTHGKMTRTAFVRPEGRWPANVILDEDAARELDEQSGMLKSGSIALHHKRTTSKTKNTYGERAAPPEERQGDSGGASRFFYVAKPSTREREAGLNHLPKKSAGELVDREEGSAGMSNPRAGAGRTSGGRANHHPTVKPIALMRYLCRLITPPGGVVLDPFCGSGTTGIGAVLEGFNFLGIEREAEYITIANARIAHYVETER